MKMLFKGHSTRLEMLIEKIHSSKESSYQDSEISGSTSSEVRLTSSDNLIEATSDSPKSQNFSDTEEEKDWYETTKNGNADNFKLGFEEGNLSERYTDSKFLQFSCPYCPREFKHKRSRDRHIKLHTGDKKYKCIQCDSAFARSDHLKIHMKTHDVKKQYNCLRCNKGYNTISAFDFHEKSHKDDLGKSNSSDNVSKILSSSEDCEDSEISQKPSLQWSNSRDFETEENTDIKTICVYCFQWFSSIELMREHIQICHRSLDDKKKCSSKTEMNKKSHETFFESDFQMESEESNGLKRPKENFTSEESPSVKRLHYEDASRSQETFICSCCYERLPNFKSFLVHMETHISLIKNKSCQQCDEESSEVLIYSSSDTASMVPLSKYLCCCQCNTYFEDSEKLQEHMVERHVVTVYKCSLCEKTFDDLPSMKVHLTAKHVSSREHFECNCSDGPKLFHDRTSAELHFVKHHSSNNITSDNWQDHKCKLGSDTNELGLREGLIESISKSTSCLSGSNLQCTYCKEYCKTKNDLHIHLRSHQIPEKSRHKCNICDETFGSSSELANHKLIHCKIVEGNICVTCKTILIDEESFVKHQFKHNDTSKSAAKLNLILPSVCIVCGQTLQSDKEIELHAKFHLKFLSEKAKSRVSEPSYSEETVFSNIDNEKTFGVVMDASLELQCHLCKKSFTGKEKLQIHLIEHNFFGINQFSCYICSSVFTGAAGLQSHLLAHNLTEKPYQCSRCSACFFFRAELDNHKYMHNLKMQFDCLNDDSASQVRHFNTWMTNDMASTESR